MGHRGPVLFITILAAGMRLPAQTADTSANGTLTGDYFVRHVILSGVQQTGGIGRARAITGVITFDGAGNYSLAGQLSDTQALPAPLAVSGTYSVGSNGTFELQNPAEPRLMVYGAVGTEAMVGSTTEGDLLHDLFVAVPARGDGTGNDALSGRYYLGSFDFLNGRGELARSAMVTLDADGQGGIADTIIYGSAMNLGNT